MNSHHPPQPDPLDVGNQATDIKVSWWLVAWRQMCHRFVVKSFGVSVFMTVFFAAYFHLLRHPISTPLLMPLTPLDTALVFRPWALVLYVSLWVYVAIAPIMQASLRGLVCYGLWIGALCLTGLAMFYFWPTAVPAFDSSAYPEFAVLQGLDSAGNACPSLHVATAAFSAYWNRQLLRELGAGRSWQWVNAAWFVLIAWSTMAVKQHVVLDVLAGLALAAAFVAMSRFDMGRRGIGTPGQGQ